MVMPPSWPGVTRCRVVMRRGLLSEGLAEFAADGVSGGFGEGGRGSGEEDVAGVGEEDERRGAEGGDREVGEDLQGTASAAALGGAEALLFAAADAGGDHGEQEDGGDRQQRGGTGGQAEDDGEKDSGERGGGGNGAQSPGKKGKGHGESDGGDQLKDGDLPALKEVHAQVNRTPKGQVSRFQSFKVSSRMRRYRFLRVAAGIGRDAPASFTIAAPNRADEIASAGRSANERNVESRVCGRPDSSNIDRDWMRQRLSPDLDSAPGDQRQSRPARRRKWF